MSCILTFLHARLDEDQQHAQAEAVLRDDDPYFVNEASNFERCFTPERMRAEVDAKRRILELHSSTETLDKPKCTHCDWQRWPCPTLRILTVPYANHLDYDPAWSVR